MLTRVVSRLPRSWVDLVRRAQWKVPGLRAAIYGVMGRYGGTDQVIASGVGKGLTIRVGPARYPGYLLGTSEPGFQEALRLALGPGMTFWDAGANVGFLALLAARLVGPSGRVVCFEPLPGCADLIEHNARVNGFGHVEVRREALGGQEGEAAFLVAAASSEGMLATSQARSAALDVVGEITVPVRTLDGLFDRPGPRPDVIKLDVEGAEVDLLRGGRRALQAHRPLLLIELHGTNAGVADVLAELNYRAMVFGRAGTLREAPAKSHVLAVPAEDAARVAEAEALCASQGDTG